MIVQLLALCPPDRAKVHVPASKKEGRAARVVELLVGNLKRKPQTAQETHIAKHPTLMTPEDDGGEVLETYEFNSLAEPFLKESLISAILHSHGSTVAALCSEEMTGSLDRIAIINLTKTNKAGEFELPVTVQARAKAFFPQGCAGHVSTY